MPEYGAIKDRYDAAFDQRTTAARNITNAASETARAAAVTAFQDAQSEIEEIRAEAQELTGANDTNYIFLSFVTNYLPIGVVGLIVGVIFTAAMSAISGEINSLATVSVIDLYKRFGVSDAVDSHYLTASRVATGFWAIYAMVFASFATNFGALIEAVNAVGSLFYGGMLGVFILAFFVKSSTGTGAFWGVLIGEIAIFTTAQFTEAFLWYNVVGALVTVGAGMIVSRLTRSPARA